MAKEHNVKVELELPEDQVSVHGADDKEDDQADQAGEPKPESQALEELKKTNRELIKTKKQVEELKEKIDSSESNEDDGMSLKEALSKELDPDEDGPIKETTGYELGEIVTAPLHAPEPEAKGRPKLTQVRNIMIGFALMPLALVCWPIFGPVVALTVAIVGALFIAIGVFFRL